MKLQLITLITLITHITAHGTHKDTDLKETVPAGFTWEEWHMKQEHGLDDYDSEVFFKLHDTKEKGFLDSLDILNIYGLRRDEVVGRGDGLGSHDDSETIDEATKDNIVKKILSLIDANKDDQITLDEYLKFAKTGGKFPDLGVGVGHHSGFEEEYEIHHWNKYHRDSDPDVKVVHREDVEHELLHHEHEIEHNVGNRKLLSDEAFEKQVKLQNIPEKYRA